MLTNQNENSTQEGKNKMKLSLSIISLWQVPLCLIINNYKSFSLQVDMHVLFPDLYQPKETVTTMMAGRVVPPTSNIKNNRQIYIASQSVGFYSMHFLSKTPTIALGFGNGKFNIHDLNTTKRCHTVEVSNFSLILKRYFFCKKLVLTYAHLNNKYQRCE